MTNEIILQKETMSSIEVAELTGKQHSNVMRDVRSLLEQGVNQINFELVNYTDRKGEKRSMFNITKKGCLLLASGYKAILREKIIDRWEALETGEAQPIANKPKKEPTLTTKVKASLMWIDGVSRYLNLNDSSKLGLLKQVAEPLGLPTPDYTPSKGILKSASELLKANQSKLSCQEFNKIMIEKGFIKVMTRESSKGEKKFKSITGDGLNYGENQVNPNNPKETQPLYYEEKFNKLLKLLAAN